MCHPSCSQVKTTRPICLGRGTQLAVLLVLVVSAADCLAQSRATRTVRGTVQDSSHAAVSGATVTIRQGTQQRTERSADDGTFSFSVSSNAAELMISASGFAQAHRSVGPGEEDAVLFILLQPEIVSTEVQVTASRTALPLSQTPASVQVIDAQEIRTSGALAVDDVLRQVAGFDLFRRNSSRTSNPTTQGVSLRGLGSSGASRAVVLLDGVPATDPFGGWMNWSQIPRAAVENVEMLRGGASDLYGGEALSGAVQLLTKTPEATDADLDISYGNQTTPNASGYVGRAFGNWLTSAAGECFRTNGYIPVQPSQRGAVDNSASSLHRNGELQLQRQISQRSRFFVRGSGYDDSRHNGTIIEVNRTRAWQAAMGFDWSGAADDLLEVRGYGGTEDYHQTFASVAANRNSETLARAQQVPSREWGFSAQYLRPVARRHTLLGGLDFAHVTGESDDEVFTAAQPSSLINAGGLDRSTGVFVEDIARLTHRWLVTGALRFDDWQTISGFSRTTTLPSRQSSVTSFQDRSETAFNPRLGTHYQIDDRLALRVSAYRSFRSPTLNELYRSFRLGNILTLANQQLRAERLTGWELGPTEKLLNGRLNMSQSFFWADVHRPISNVTQSATAALITRQRQNLGSTRARGLEAQADWSAMKWINLAAQYQFVDAQVTSFAADQRLVGLLVPEIPRHEFTFQARYSNPRFLSLAVQGRSSSSVFDDDQNTLSLGSYFKMDAFVSRRINSLMDVYAAGENLLNQHYLVARTPIVTLGSPLVARAGIQVHLRR
ncbi:MAG TPA: TonB-dependent receptor [Terriglobales bacterium]|nr:TonB-dependent receptor [Terriglobales bacterium]